MQEEEIRNIIDSSVSSAVKQIHPELEKLSYKVGRKLQEESHSQFMLVFQHVLNIDPSKPDSVKELQKTLNHAEEHRLNNDADGRSFRKGIITLAFGWLSSIVVFAWFFVTK